MTKKKEKLEKGQIYLISQALLGGWFCAEKDMEEDDVALRLSKLIGEHNTMLEVPTSDIALFKDRLFGGFHCNNENRSHIYYALGHYTFRDGEEQTPLAPETRKEIWLELMKRNQWTGGGPFCKDKPPN